MPPTTVSLYQFFLYGAKLAKSGHGLYFRYLDEDPDVYYPLAILTERDQFLYDYFYKPYGSVCSVHLPRLPEIPT
jgi:hypothetical protein